MTRGRELTELPRGLRRRLLPSAKMAARAGWSHVLRMAGRKPAPDAMAALVSAADLVEDLGSFKGLFMKVGQLASFMPAREPDAALGLMARLQDSSIAFAYGEIAKVVEAELGGAPEKLFERFDRKPVAVASIGQVHRARLGGRELAVKVQFPGIEEAIREDFAVLGPLLRLGTLGTKLDMKGLVSELKLRIGEECDYRREAENQQLFARLLAPVPFAGVPVVIPERSGRRVLAMEFVEGLDYRRFRATASQAARNRAGEAIFRAGLESCFVRCVCNGDPQPGNYLFAEDGAVTFLDFGCVYRAEPAKIELWKQLLSAVLDGDRAGYRRAWVALGYVPDPRRYDWEQGWRVAAHAHEVYASRGPFRITRGFMDELYANNFYRNPNAYRQALPPDALMINRAAFGRLALLADLGAEAPWGDLMRELLETKTEPAWDPPAKVAAARPERRAARKEATA
ncbi:MAG TPA: AarF/ABC1/UbiB kinase family protein [Anaeromyxobacteraceae bacterium]|nr:AarF/ABC1/UbiB kinase family protein [Anaeromyxobacteraceae bacterium]